MLVALVIQHAMRMYPVILSVRPYHFFPRYLNIKETCVTISWNSLGECQKLLLLNKITSITVGIHLGFIVINEPFHPHSNIRRGGGGPTAFCKEENFLPIFENCGVLFEGLL